MRIGNSIYNRFALHNSGIRSWITNFSKFFKNQYIILSISGTDDELEEMVNIIESAYLPIKGIELNYSCPNVHNQSGKRKVPNTSFPVWIKLSHLQDPYNYELDKIKGIRVNSVPCWFGGGSGKIAQNKNWNFISKFNREGLNVAGCSFLDMNDIRYLEEYCGCSEIGIGSTILINPRLIEWLGGVSPSLAVY